MLNITQPITSAVSNAAQSGIGSINSLINATPLASTVDATNPTTLPPIPGTKSFDSLVAPVDPSNTYSPRPVPAQWQPYLQQAYQQNPSIHPGVLEAILMKESSMGTNPGGYNPGNGQSAWLAGLTPDAQTALTSKGITPDFNSQNGAIQAMASYLAMRQKGVDNNGKQFNITDPSQLYFQRYKTSANPTTPQERQNFENYVNYYSGALANQ